MRRTLRFGMLAVLIAVVLIGGAGIAIAVTFGHVAECPVAALPQALALRVTLLTRGESLTNVAGTDATPLKFTVQPAEPYTDIAQGLADVGLIRDPAVFDSFVRFCGYIPKLQAGTYLLNGAQTIPQIAQALTDAGTSAISFRVLEGWRVEQIAAAIDATPLIGFKGADFLALVQPGSALPAWFTQAIAIPPGAPLEGIWFPDTYQLPLNATAADLRDALLRNFLARVTPQMQADVAAQKLTLYQAIELASIVEREAVVDEERPIIAGVYLNRLRQSITLDADPTIQYALGQSRTPGNWWPNITLDDYHGVQSPYNAYLHPGLPPGPIANPGLASLRAAIYPAQTPYFYFRADCIGDGRHRFAVTFADQQANACSN